MSWKEQIKKEDKRIKTTKTTPIDADYFTKPKKKKNKYDEDQDETVAA